MPILRSFIEPVSNSLPDTRFQLENGYTARMRAAAKGMHHIEPTLHRLGTPSRFGELPLLALS